MSGTPRTDAIPHNVADLAMHSRKLEREIDALRKDKERLDWLMEVMEALQEHLNRIQRENAELRKDKERLDWVLSHEGRYWLSFREDIDREMEEAQ